MTKLPINRFFLNLFFPFSIVPTPPHYVELLKICLNYLKLLQYHLISTIQQNHQFIGQKTYSTGRPQTQMEKKMKPQCRKQIEF